mgnify:CR=1 FL=1
MKKSNNKKTRDVTAFIYPRLSRDDNLEGESYSISNQKKLLTKTAKDMGYTNIVTFVDDGVSWTRNVCLRTTTQDCSM